jgi:hypothetical protein
MQAPGRKALKAARCYSRVALRLGHGTRMSLSADSRAAKITGLAAPVRKRGSARETRGSLRCILGATGGSTCGRRKEIAGGRRRVIISGTPSQQSRNGPEGSISNPADSPGAQTVTNALAATAHHQAGARLIPAARQAGAHRGEGRVIGRRVPGRVRANGACGVGPPSAARLGRLCGSPMAVCPVQIGGPSRSARRGCIRQLQSGLSSRHRSRPPIPALLSRTASPRLSRCAALSRSRNPPPS